MSRICGCLEVEVTWLWRGQDRQVKLDTLVYVPSEAQ